MTRSGRVAACVKTEAKAWPELESQIQLQAQRIKDDLKIAEAKAATDECMRILGQLLVAVKDRPGAYVPTVRLLRRGQVANAFWSSPGKNRGVLLCVSVGTRGEKIVRLSRARVGRGWKKLAKRQWEYDHADTFVDNNVMPELRKLFE